MIVSLEWEVELLKGNPSFPAIYPYMILRRKSRPFRIDRVLNICRSVDTSAEH